MIEIIKNLLGGMLKHPTLSKNVRRVRRDVYTYAIDLTAECLKSAEPIPYEDLKNHAFEKIEKGDLWADEKFGCAWFKLTGKVPTELQDKHPVVVFNINGEALAYSDDTPFDIATTIMGVGDVLQGPGAGKRIFDLTGKVKEDGSFTLYVDCGNNGVNGNFVFKPKFVYAYLATKNDEVSDFYYDYLTVALLLAAEEKVSFDSKCADEVKGHLVRSFNLYKKGDIEGAKAVLAPLYDENSPVHKYINKRIDKVNPVDYTCIGHAHLDLCWLWPQRETIRKALRTFTNALSLIEKNDHFIFGASQAQMFDWMRTESPETFEKIKKAVADGNIEIQGGMWTECDCNLPSGESIIRQFHYGEEFFLEHFGKSSNTMWLPDVFGYPCTLPQIIKGVGKDNFATIKLSWNKTNTFPYQTFKWVAPDGSKVTAHLSPEGTYTNEASPLTIAKSNRKNLQKEVGKALVIYGNGDGGGGAGESHVELIEREQKLYSKGKVTFGTTDSFFEKIGEDIPEYKGELYLEKHRGTYTSQSENKRLNRMNEHALHTLEWLSAVGTLRGEKFDKEEVDNIWKTVLFNQFHDILPGSSIERVHRESRAELNEALSLTNDKINTLIGKMSGVNSLFVLNPSPFEQTVYTENEGKILSATVGAYSSAPLVEAPYTLPSVTDKTLENDRVRIVFSSEGNVISYFDKVRGTERAKGELGKFIGYHDKKLHYNAWDIDNDYLSHPIKVKHISTRSYHEGVYGVVEHTYRLGDSTIVEKVKLGVGTEVTFDITVDWKETHKMLRVQFEPRDYSDTVECDVQFGSIQRATTENDSIEKEQFEICAHKYVATGTRGLFALYSNSKYGFRVKNGMMSINLLRSPIYPDPTCDRMVHHISYKMDFPEDRKELVAKAYNFNLPALILDKAVDVKPVVTLDNNSVIIETVKPTDDGIALRIYERYGAKADVNLTVNFPYTAIYESNLLEKDQVSASTHLTFRPHEIKTIIIKTK